MATATRKTTSPGTDENSILLDFSKVGPRGGGRAAHVPEGDYLLEVAQLKNVEIASGDNKGGRMIGAQLRIVGTPNSPEARKGMGDTVYQNMQIGEKSLWFVRNLIEDLTGKEVTGQALRLPLDKMTGKQVGATLVDGRPYERVDKDTGEVVTTIRSEIKYTFPAERFVGYRAGESAVAAKADENGISTPAAAAAAVSEPEPSPDEQDDLDVQDLDDL